MRTPRIQKLTLQLDKKENEELVATVHSESGNLQYKALIHVYQAFLTWMRLTKDIRTLVVAAFAELHILPWHNSAQGCSGVSRQCEQGETDQSLNCCCVGSCSCQTVFVSFSHKSKFCRIAEDIYTAMPRSRNPAGHSGQGHSAYTRNRSCQRVE